MSPTHGGDSHPSSLSSPRPRFSPSPHVAHELLVAEQAEHKHTQAELQGQLQRLEELRLRSQEELAERAHAQAKLQAQMQRLEELRLRSQDELRGQRAEHERALGELQGQLQPACVGGRPSECAGAAATAAAGRRVVGVWG